MWAHEFQHQQQIRQQHMMQQQQQQAKMMHQQQQSHSSNWSADMMRSRMMGGPMGGMMGGMGMMGMGMHMGMSHGQYSVPPVAASASSSSASASAIQEMPANVSEEEFDNLFSDSLLNNGSLEDAYKVATDGQDWSNPPVVESEVHGPGLAGGMDKEMLEKLVNSDNPKWRNSKFLKFIDKISKGEIEFRDNQAFEKPAGSGSAAAEQEWSNEFGAASQMSGEEWADEFSIQQNHPASWSDQFAGQEQHADSHLAEEKSQAEKWLEDYTASGEADTEFKDFDWQQALAKAKEDLPARADPKYDFQEKNPFADSADPFSDGVKLFKDGRIKEAILAFEATVKKQEDHADAWAYLGEAQAQNEEENNAIAAFLQCVAIDPYNLKALLQLGVSYTNDLEEVRTSLRATHLRFYFLCDTRTLILSSSCCLVCSASRARLFEDVDAE
jgi:hypothetical protein